jgi:hypothetical protein
MYRVFLVGLLLLAIPAVAVAARAAVDDTKKDSAKKAEGETLTKIRVGDVETQPVSVIAAPEISLSYADKILLAGVVILLAVVIAQLVFLRSSVERLAGERSVSNPSGTTPPRP